MLGVDVASGLALLAAAIAALVWIALARRRFRAAADAPDGTVDTAPTHVVLQIFDQALQLHSDTPGAEGMALLSMRVRAHNGGEAPVRLVRWTVHAGEADGWFLNPDEPLVMAGSPIPPANLIFNVTAQPIAPGESADGLCFALFRPEDLRTGEDVEVVLVAIDGQQGRHPAVITLPPQN